MGILSRLLWEAVEGWIPWPESRVEAAPWVFYPLFTLLVAALIRKHTLEFREAYREALARGQGRAHLWGMVISLVIIGGLGFWFIRS